MMADQLQMVTVIDGDITSLQMYQKKATEMLAKPKLDVRLFGYTLPERLQELRDAIALKSMFLRLNLVDIRLDESGFGFRECIRDARV